MRIAKYIQEREVYLNLQKKSQAAKHPQAETDDVDEIEKMLKEQEALIEDGYKTEVSPLTPGK